MKTWSFRACALTAALLVLAPIFVPLSAHADIIETALCNETGSPQVSGSGLANFEHIDYNSDGWLQFHFNFEAGASTHTLSMLYNRQYGASCNTKVSYTASHVVLPDNITSFSLRTKSFGDYHIYDDTTDQPISCSGCQVFMPVSNDADPSDRLILKISLTDNSGALLSTSQHLWDPNRALPPRPVIIIPGITGTTMIKGSDTLWPNLSQMLFSPSDGFMDPLAFNPDLTPSDPQVGPDKVIDKMEVLHIPVMDYTDGLMNALTAAGYQGDKNVFLFPYDWRQPLPLSAANLRNFVSNVQRQTGFWYVNAIAHSMGGLVLRHYVNQNTVGTIDKAVFVGTPFVGAPKALKTLLFGDNLGVPVLSPSEIKKIGRNMPGLYDLLPTRTYYDFFGSALGLTQTATYDETMNYGANQGLNTAAWQAADTRHTRDYDTYYMGLKGVNIYTLAGCTTPTLSKLVQHTRPDGTVDGMVPVFTEGDGTVPADSAVFTPMDAGQTLYALKSDHAHLLSTKGVREQIVRLLSGDTQTVDPDVTMDARKCGLSGRLISIFSPLDITAQTSDGQMVGRLPDGQIRQDLPNAGYEELGDHKFLFWPDDAPEPTISLQGTATGTFTLSVETIKDNASMDIVTYQDIPVTESLLGQLDLANSSNLLLDVDGDGQIDQTLTGDNIAPEISLSFDPATHSLIFAGEDNSGQASVSQQGTTVTVNDAVGNISVLQISEVDGKKSMKVQLQSLTYNGTDASVSPAKLDYAWSADNLTQELTAYSTTIRAVFDGKNTKITTKTGSGKGQVQTVTGLALIKLVTYKGNVKWSW